MTRARQEQISLEATSFYHCYVRCVRRAYLCGDDHISGENFDHRKQWIVSRLRFLSSVYAIDICAYAVMSNHYHVVLHVDSQRAANWSDEEVASRWMQLYKGHILVTRWLQNDDVDEATLDSVKKIITAWRERLSSVSWFMRCINETIARMANEEDGCKGRFWEGRFRSQALLDEAAVLSCMAYVDLDPVRAGMAKDVVDSDFTSIQQRVIDYSRQSKSVKNANTSDTLTQGLKRRDNVVQELKRDLNLDKNTEADLMPFDGSRCFEVNDSHTDIHAALPFTREDYFDLVDLTGRLIRDDKRRYIAADIPPIVSRLGINPDKWLNHIKKFGHSYGNCSGSADNIVNFAAKFDSRWGKGKRNSCDVYLCG